MRHLVLRCPATYSRFTVERSTLGTRLAEVLREHAEVGHQGISILRQEQIRRLDVAMDDTVLVGVLQRLAGFMGDGKRFLERKLPSRPRRSLRLSLSTYGIVNQRCPLPCRSEHSQDMRDAGDGRPCGSFSGSARS